jgi:hypothetical protein
MAWDRTWEGYPRAFAGPTLQAVDQGGVMPRSTSNRAPIARLTGLVAATALGVAMIASPAGAAEPPDRSLESVSNLVEPSIVQLHTQYAGLVRDGQSNDLTGGKPVKVDATCSGFVVNANGYIATAGRCVDLDVATDRLIDVVASDVFNECRASTACAN